MSDSEAPCLEGSLLFQTRANSWKLSFQTQEPVKAIGNSRLLLAFTFSVTQCLHLLGGLQSLFMQLSGELNDFMWTCALPAMSGLKGIC